MERRLAPKAYDNDGDYVSPKFPPDVGLEWLREVISGEARQESKTRRIIRSEIVNEQRAEAEKHRGFSPLVSALLHPNFCFF